MKRDKFPALRDLGKQILNQELQKTVSKVFKHTDAIIRSRTGKWSTTIYLVPTQMSIIRKPIKREI